MERFKEILYVTNYRENEEFALQEAVKLATENDARLTVASMSPKLPDLLPKEKTEQLYRDIQSIERHRQAFVLSDQLRPFEEDGGVLEHVTFTGVQFIEIIQRVMAFHHDLVILPSWPMHDDGTGFNSLTQHVLRNCPCAVLAIRYDCAEGFTSVLAAVDPVTETDVQKTLNRSIIHHALRQAGRYKARVDIVHAWQVAGEEWLKGPLVEVDEEGWDMLRTQTEIQHRKALDEQVSEIDHSGLDVSGHLIEGAPGQVIIHSEQTFNSDLIVMGTLNRTGIEGFFMGHTAEEVIQTTQASILALKPVSFVSPLGVYRTKE